MAKPKKKKRKIAKSPKAKKRKIEKAKKPKREKAKKKKLVSRLGAKPKAKRAKRVKKKALKTRKAPRGFEDVAKSKDPEQAEGEIRERLESIRERLSEMEIDSRVRIHRYQDESIDGELLVKVPYGVSADNLALDMEQAMGRDSMPGFWINMGTRFTIKEDEQVYRRFRGFNDVSTHYQAAVPANWSEIPLIVRKVIIKGMEKKYGRKADSVYLRIHWSPDGDKPRNRG